MPIKTAPALLQSPTAEQIAKRRLRLKLTQDEAAVIVGSTARRWREWEHGDHRMHPGLWELFKLKSEGTVFMDAPE